MEKQDLKNFLNDALFDSESAADIHAKETIEKLIREGKAISTSQLSRELVEYIRIKNKLK